MNGPNPKETGQNSDPKPVKTPDDNPSTKPSPAVAPFDELEWAEKVYPDSQAIAAYREARAAVNNLVALANNGDKVAARFLWKLTHDTTRWISLAKSPGGDLVRSLAPEYRLWPVLLSSHPRAVREAKEEVERLRVGEQSGFRSDKHAKWGESKDGTHDQLPGATQCAADLVQYIQGIQYQFRLSDGAAEKMGEKADYSHLTEWQLKCKDLPPLSKQTVPQWWPIAKAAFLSGTNDHPENVESLRRLATKHLRRLVRL
ncbi:MAG: hypothetical protein ABSD58_11315 [Verrucomicrobiia bacterium]|jgi:hypothetical protein